MGSLYSLIVTVHNAFGGITLILTLATGIILLATARTTSNLSSTMLRATMISASIQAALGILMVLLGFVLGMAGYIAGLWLHYLLGIASVGVISVIAARARREPDSAARRYGAIMLGIFVLVFVTFLVGQFSYNPLA